MAHFNRNVLNNLSVESQKNNQNHLCSTTYIVTGNDKALPNNFIINFIQRVLN